LFEACECDYCQHRVKVEELIDKPYEPKAKVYFIDSGRKKEITRVELIALPERFASVPHQVNYREYITVSC